MGRPCKYLQLSPSHLRDLEELSVQAKTLGSCDVVLRIRGLVMVARRHSYREVAACLGVTSGTVSNWVGNFESQGYEGLLTEPHPGLPPPVVLAAVWIVWERPDVAPLTAATICCW